MLEIKDNKVKLKYEFDSNYVDEASAKYDFKPFVYKIGVDDAKDMILWSIMEEIERKEESITFLNESLDLLEEWGCFDWGKIIKQFEDVLLDYFRMDAMQWFADNHYETTKDDYDEEH